MVQMQLTLHLIHRDRWRRSSEGCPWPFVLRHLRSHPWEQYLLQRGKRSKEARAQGHVVLKNRAGLRSSAMLPPISVFSVSTGSGWEHRHVCTWGATACLHVVRGGHMSLILGVSPVPPRLGSHRSLIPIVSINNLGYIPIDKILCVYYGHLSSYYISSCTICNG